MAILYPIGTAKVASAPQTAALAASSTADLNSVLSGMACAASAAAADVPAQPYNLSDDFNDNDIDPATWDASAGGSTTVLDIRQRLEITPDANATNYGFLQSHQSYDMTDASFVVKLVQKLNDGPASETLFGLQRANNSNNKLLWLIGYGNIAAQVRTPSTTTVASLPYVPANHSWFRIRQDSSTGKVYWDYAPASASNPPVEGDWVNLASRAAPFEVTDAKAFLGAGCWSATASPGTAIFDGVNTQANLPARSADASNTLANVGVSATATGQAVVVSNADLAAPLSGVTALAAVSAASAANANSSLAGVAPTTSTSSSVQAEVAAALRSASVQGHMVSGTPAFGTYVQLRGFVELVDEACYVEEVIPNFSVDVVV